MINLLQSLFFSLSATKVTTPWLNQPFVFADQAIRLSNIPALSLTQVSCIFSDQTSSKGSGQMCSYAYAVYIDKTIYAESEGSMQFMRDLYNFLA